MVPEKAPLGDSLEVKPITSITSTEQKSEHPQTRQKTAQSTNLSAPTAPAGRDLSADNRLLDLLEKDLDKALEQSKERRHLQFS
ncbi:MAG TPA: hypothetical protein VGK57_19025, partial [Candidatus Binatia bacterium]